MPVTPAAYTCSSSPRCCTAALACTRCSDAAPGAHRYWLHGGALRLTQVIHAAIAPVQPGSGGLLQQVLHLARQHRAKAHVFWRCGIGCTSAGGSMVPPTALAAHASSCRQAINHTCSVRLQPPHCDTCQGSAPPSLPLPSLPHPIPVLQVRAICREGPRRLHLSQHRMRRQPVARRAGLGPAAVAGGGAGAARPAGAATAAAAPATAGLLAGQRAVHRLREEQDAARRAGQTVMAHA